MDLYALLRANNVALAWVDSPNMPLAAEVTSDFLYVRLEGDRKKVNGLLGKIETDTLPNLTVLGGQIEAISEQGNGGFWLFREILFGLSSFGCDLSFEFAIADFLELERKEQKPLV